MTDRKLMQQALEVLALIDGDIEWREPSPTRKVVGKAIAALRERLAQPEQEPEYCNPGTELYKVAARVMSDCGHSSNNQRLLDRVAQRIEKHLDAHAVLVAAAEREACAALVHANALACDPGSMLQTYLASNAAALRARRLG